MTDRMAEHHERITRLETNHSKITELNGTMSVLAERVEHLAEKVADVRRIWLKAGIVLFVTIGAPTLLDKFL